MPDHAGQSTEIKLRSLPILPVGRSKRQSTRGQDGFHEEFQHTSSPAEMLMDPAAQAGNIHSGRVGESGERHSASMLECSSPDHPHGYSPVHKRGRNYIEEEPWHR